MQEFCVQTPYLLILIFVSFTQIQRVCVGKLFDVSTLLPWKATLLRNDKDDLSIVIGICDDFKKLVQTELVPYFCYRTESLELHLEIADFICDSFFSCMPNMTLSTFNSV